MSPRRSTLAVLLILFGCRDPGTPESDLDDDAGADSTDGGTGGGASSNIPGDRLLRGNFILEGVTSDGWALVTDVGGATATRAVRLDPAVSPPDVAAVAWGPVHVVIDGRLVFAFSPRVTDKDAGDLLAWSAMLGAARLLGTRAPLRLVDGSDDGTLAGWGKQAGEDGRSVDLLIGPTDRPGAARIVAAAVPGPSSECPPALAFAGRELLFLCCNAQESGGAPDPAPAIYAAGEDGTVRKIGRTTLLRLLLGPGRRHVLTASEDGRAHVVLIADPSRDVRLPDVGPVREALFTPAGDAVIVRTETGGVVRVPIDEGGAPRTLVPGGAARLRALSPDGASLLFATKVDDALGYGDLRLASTLVPAAATLLVSDARGALFGDAFTSDGKRALFFADATDAYVGRLRSRPTSGPAATRTHSDGAWVARAASGSQVVWNERFQPVALRRGRADLVFGDVGKSEPPLLLVPQADADFFLTPARDAIVFTVSATTPTGLYLLPLAGIGGS